jgi:hypothetical protein
MNIEQLLQLVYKDAAAQDISFQAKQDPKAQTLNVMMKNDDGEFEYHVPDLTKFGIQIYKEAGSEEGSACVDAFWAVLNDHYQL